ncbi:MAG TPA: hypothetical protein PLN52_19290 [Opitutaceae bacterium]|nr:hypothetical protein [Opitutaceae bacterium]
MSSPSPSSPNPPPSLGEDLRLDHCQDGQSAQAWVWWNHVPTLPGEKIGAIGNFRADGPDAARAVLKKAEDALTSQGCTLAVGPMDGNIWRRYRFITEPGSEPPFFLEPVNPPLWPLWWETAGYAPLASYYSTVANNLAWRDPRVETVATRLRAAGIVIRAITRTNFVDDLRRIYDVSVESFQENYLYTPLPADAFLSQYLPLKDRVVPDLILLAEDKNNRPVGYVFVVPDLAQAMRTPQAPITTVIVKTLAVRPGRAYAGLGAWLLAEVHEAARRLGYTRAIHALMHETNRSRNLSAHYAETIRRYTLFSKRLG